MDFIVCFFLRSIDMRCNSDRTCEVSQGIPESYTSSLQNDLDYIFASIPEHKSYISL